MRRVAMYAAGLSAMHVAVQAACQFGTASQLVRERDLAGHVFLVTGSDRGMGFATALALAHTRAKVVLATHNLQSGDRAAQNITQVTGNTHVHTVELDLSSFRSIRSIVDQLHKHHVHRIDAIVCNAAMGVIPSSLPVLTENGYNRMFQVNFLGNVLLVNLLLPMLRATSGRVVLVASGVDPDNGCRWAKLPARSCVDVDSLRQTAKSEIRGAKSLKAPNLYGFTKNLQIFHAAEIGRLEAAKGSGVRAYSLFPAVIATELSRSMGFKGSTSSPDSGAVTQTFLASAASLPTEANGQYFKDCEGRPLTALTTPFKTSEKLVEFQQKLLALASALTESTYPLDARAVDLRS